MDYGGRISVHCSLLNVVLEDQQIGPIGPIGQADPPSP
jgi:hypothetical protein